MLCTTCDTRNEVGSRFCRICGTPLTAPAAQESAATRPMYTLSDAPMTGPACGACGRINPVGAKYCVYCATLLTPGARMSGALPAMQPAFASVSTTVYVMPQPPMINVASSGNLLLRAIWFFVIGWWLGLIWTIVAWLFNLTLIGLPVGVMMLNAIPKVTTLRRQSNQPYHHLRPFAPQHPLALRAIWFVIIGWWASLVWSLVAWAFSLTWILMPISFWMWNRVPTITTLAAEQ